MEENNIINNIKETKCPVKNKINQKKKKKTNEINCIDIDYNNNNKTNNISSNDAINYNLVKGHRQRLKNKFKISKDSFENYELLEMLLFYVFSRIDTRTLAKTLLLKFNNSLENVINADENQLKEINGVGESVITLFKLIQEINCRIIKNDIVKNNNIDNNNILNSISSIKKYFKNKIGNLVREEILVLFLNNKCNLVAEEIINTGNTNESTINNSLIITKAINNGSSRIVLAHNHPSGDYTPSVNDIKITQELKELLSNFGIELLEHIVVSKNGAIGIIESGMVE